MTKQDKELIKSMIKALGQFERCLPGFSDDSWKELSLKIGEKGLPTWNEISGIKNELQVIGDEITSGETK